MTVDVAYANSLNSEFVIENNINNNVDAIVTPLDDNYSIDISSLPKDSSVQQSTQLEGGVLPVADMAMLQRLAPYKASITDVQSRGLSPIERFSNSKNFEIDDSSSYALGLLSTFSLATLRSIFNSGSFSKVSVGMFRNENGEDLYNIVLKPVNGLMLMMGLDTQTFFNESRFEVNFSPTASSIFKLIAFETEDDTQAGIEFQLKF